MPESGPHVVVVGGGIAGLVAARTVRQHAPHARLTLVEAADRLGGKISTQRFAGADVDLGADAFLARVEGGTDLARDLGVDHRLVAPAATRAHVWSHGKLRRLPAGTLYGVPKGIGPLLSTHVVPRRTALRAGFDRVLPGKPPAGDVAVRAHLTRRVGRGLVDGLVEPMLGGIYAGRSEELSLFTAVPQLGDAARAHRSVLRGVRAAQSSTEPDAGPVFYSFDGGLAVLVDALRADLGGATVRVGVRAAALERLGGRSWRLTLAGGTALIADAVVLAVPAAAAARLLRGVAPEAAAALDGVDYASVATIALGYPRRSLAGPPESSGFLVPPSADWMTKGVTVSFAKWAHLRSANLLVVRASVGRIGETEWLDLDDGELVSRVHSEISQALTVRSAPVDAKVTRWLDALPQYTVGHGERVATVTTAVAAQPGLAVAGAAYEGLGIPACIRSGRAAGARIAAHVANWGTPRS